MTRDLRARAVPVAFPKIPMTYIDAFVLPVPKKNLAAYTRMARKGARVWIDHGALAYHETVGDDLASPCGRPFPDLVAPKRGEVLVFSWILYRSRRHRDRVNAAAMKDPRMAKFVTDMPFDMTRMTHGGFRTIVEARAKR